MPLSQIKTPLLTCASWSTQGLHNRGSFEGFKQAASEEKWLYVHGRKEWESYYAREISNAKNHSLILPKKIEFSDFIKAKASAYLTQNIHHCI